MAALKTDELRSILDKFADLLVANGCDQATSRGLKELSAVFASGEIKSLAAFVKIAEGLPAPGETGLPAGGQTLAAISSALDHLRFVFQDVAKDVTDGLATLVKTLKPHAALPASVFVTNFLAASKPEKPTRKPKPEKPKPEAKPKTGSKTKDVAVVNENLVEDYVRRLEASLGDDAKFQPLFSEISADQRIKAAESVAIATRFYGRIAKSTSRPKALERIRERHTKVVNFKQQPSTSGRSAA
jgi:hypothetical protein